MGGVAGVAGPSAIRGVAVRAAPLPVRPFANGPD
jgi:hypothetical protein